MNKVIFIGNLSKDFEANEAITVARGSMALNRGKDKNGNDLGADFPSLVAFGKTAEALTKFGKKGRKFAIEGHLQTGSYEKNGSRVYTADVIVDRWEFADSKPQEQLQPNIPVEVNDDGFLDIPEGIDEELPFM